MEHLWVFLNSRFIILETKTDTKFLEVYLSSDEA